MQRGNATKISFDDQYSMKQVTGSSADESMRLRF